MTSGELVQRDAAAAAILNSADVVFSTLAFSGSATFRKITAAFETIVIDEAAQALEPSCLVPLSPSVRQVYLIGDPVQLPATVISKRAVKANFEQSLFKRLQDAGYPVHILQVRVPWPGLLLPAVCHGALVLRPKQGFDGKHTCRCNTACTRASRAW